jgi:serine protease AprX
MHNHNHRGHLTGCISRLKPTFAAISFALLAGLALSTAPHSDALAVTPEAPVAPAPGANGSPPAGSLGDKDGNGIADGLEHKMKGVAAGTQIRVIVTMVKGVGVAAAKAAAGPFAVHRTFTIINGFAASMTRSQIEALSRAPGVMRVDDDVEVKAHLQDAMTAYGVKRIHAGIAQGLAADYDGAGVGVCVVDTGIDATHAELDGGKLQNFCDATTGGCFAGDLGTGAYDDHGHGTHVSSISVGDSGVAPAANLWGAKVLAADGTGPSSDIVAGIEWCAAQTGVHVINMSLGAIGTADGTDPMSVAANTAALTKVVTLSAGNTGPAQLQISAPAAAENPITVAASADWISPVDGWRKGLAVFSSRGPTADFRIKPDITAPGVSITAAKAGGGTVTFSGTSMASPFVAGVAALMLNADPGLSPAAVKTIIAATARTRGDSSVLDAVGFPKNYDYGWGELDAFAAVAEASGAVGYTPTAFPVQLYQNPTIADTEVWEYEFEVTDPTTQISANVYNGGVWTSLYLLGTWWTNTMGQDFDAQLHAPVGTPGGTLVDESTCEVDADTQCGIAGRQETLVADPADFGGSLPLDTWKLRVEPWDDTDGLAAEIIDAVITLGPLGGSPPPPNEAPTANFYFSVSGAEVTFTDTSTDDDATLKAWAWDFGNEFSSTAQHPVYIYPSAGTYQVTLTVTDNDDVTAQITKEVIVTTGGGGGGGGGTETADFVSSVDSATGEVSLTGSPIGGTNYAWIIESWPGGWKSDPNPLTQTTPESNLATFTATKSGDYVVNLAVTTGTEILQVSKTVSVSLSGGGGGGGGGGDRCHPVRGCP